MSSKKLTLQEQLLKAGLASDAKAKEIRSDKRKQSKQRRHSKVEPADGKQKNLNDIKVDQVARDRKLNLEKKIAAEKKEITAQIKQLIEQNKKAMDQEGVKYNFVDHNKVKTVYVPEIIRNQLIKGILAIVRDERNYAIVPIGVAKKIELRDKTMLIVLNETNQALPITDSYSDYQVPDDLIW